MFVDYLKRWSQDINCFETLSFKVDTNNKRATVMKLAYRATVDIIAEATVRLKKVMMEEIMRADQQMNVFCP